MNRRNAWIGVVVAGALCTAAIPGILDSRIAGFLALAPLYAALQNQHPVRAFFMGWICCGMAVFVGSHWVISSSETIFGYSFAAGTGVLLLVSLYQGLQYAAAALVHSLSQKSMPPWLSFALCFATADALFPHLFPLSHGLFLHSAPVLLQTADIAGHATITFFVAVVNASMVDAMFSPKRVDPAVRATAAVAIMLGYAGVRIPQIDHMVVNAPSIRVAVVQTGTFPKEAQAENRRLLQTHAQMSREIIHKEHIDLLIWGECLLNTAVRKGDLHWTLASLLKGISVPVMLGVPIRSDGEEHPPQHTNSVVLAQPDGWVCPDCRYDKNVLFPIGEQFVSAQNATRDSMAVAAKESTPLTFNGHNLTTYICYEALLPNYVRKLAASGEMLINPSYDGWFGHSSEPAIHEALARIRAIENRKPLIRAAMSGISTIVDPAGRILARTSVGESVVITGNVSFMKRGTVYTTLGNLPWILVLVWLILCTATKRIHPHLQR